MELPVRTMENEVVDRVEVGPDLLETPPKTYVVWEVVRHYLACRRRGTHSTKTRGEVRGGGRKPWRQKGTGRARHGSIRSPLWVGGGTVFGPKPRDYAYPLPAKKTRLALRVVLADRLREGRVTVLHALAMERPSTKAGVALLERLQLRPGADRVLFVDVQPEENFVKSVRNIPGVDVAAVRDVHVYHLLTHTHLVLTRRAFEELQRISQP
jgi:large subunit ribosomal protein L4